MRRLKRFFYRFRMNGLTTNQKFLLALGADIVDEYQKNRNFRRHMDKTKYSQHIKTRIKNWNNE